MTVAALLPQSWQFRLIGLNLKPAYRYRPDIPTRLKYLRSFLRVSARLGFSRATGALYWRMFFTVLLRNPRGIEAAVNLAAMFIHFARQKDYVVGELRRSLDEAEAAGGN